MLLLHFYVIVVNIFVFELLNKLKMKEANGIQKDKTIGNSLQK